VANRNPPRENLRPQPWGPGESGNPAGSSKKQRLTAALFRMLDEKGLDEPFIRAGMAAALKGDFQFWKYIYERIDGKLPDAEGGGDAEEIIEEAQRKADEHRRRRGKGR
jgi:hypothetical protein